MNRSLIRKNNGILTIANGNEEIANFDFQGRLLFYTHLGVTYRRSYAGSLYKLSWDNDLRIVEKIPPPEAEIMIKRTLEMARNFPTQDITPEEKSILSTISSRDVSWVDSDTASITSLYSRIPVLPPDQASSLYLELATGCKWNRCTVCSSYNSREFNDKTIEEFREHISNVKAVMGEGLYSRKSVFLGDANALDVDQKILLQALDDVKSELNLPVFASFDVFTTPKKKNMIHYRDLKEHGLERIFVFLESGSYKVIKLFNQHRNITETLNIVNNIKDYGISVSIVLMVGTGGRKYNVDHVMGSANIISQMNLENGDMIFLSPIVEEDDETYMEISRKNDLGNMTPEEKMQQTDDLIRSVKKAYLDMNGKDLDVPVVKYDLRESIF